VHGLSQIPTLDEIASAANDLQRREAIDASTLALYTQWARLDPRFAEILVDYVGSTWANLRVGEFINALIQLPWPRAAVVILDFAALARDDEHLRSLSSGLLRGLPPMEGTQLFFVPLRWPNAVVLRNELLFNVDPYRRSGFIGSQSLLSRARWPLATRLPRRARNRILRDLLDQGRDITVAEYRRQCRDLISVRQAQRDLAQHAKPKGFTRNRRYRAATEGT
jgi:hypothetical protein